MSIRDQRLRLARVVDVDDGQGAKPAPIRRNPPAIALPQLGQTAIAEPYARGCELAQALPRRILPIAGRAVPQPTVVHRISLTARR